MASLPLLYIPCTSDVDALDEVKLIAAAALVPPIVFDVPAAPPLVAPMFTTPADIYIALKGAEVFVPLKLPDIVIPAMVLPCKLVTVPVEGTFKNTGMKAELVVPAKV